MPRAQENRTFNEVLGLGLLAVGTLLFLALISFDPREVPAGFFLSTHASSSSAAPANSIGPLGAILACVFYFMFGAASYLAAAALLGYGGALLLSATTLPVKRIPWILTFIITGACILILQPWFLKHWPIIRSVGIDSRNLIGGWFGWRFVDRNHGILINIMGTVGSSILLVCLYVTSLIMMTGIHPILILRRSLALPSKLWERYYNYRLARATDREKLDLEQKRMERQARKLEKQLTKKGYPAPHSGEEPEEE